MPKKEEPIDEGVPRYRITMQDGVTGVQISAGTDDLNLFTKTDLMKFVKHFKQQIKNTEESPLEREMARRKKLAEKGK